MTPGLGALPVTEGYARYYRALKEAATEHGTAPFVARLVYAIAESGGQETTDRLEEALCDANPSMIRRAVGTLFRRGWARGINTVDGGPPKRGCRTRLILTDSGAGLAGAVRSRLAEFTEVAA